MVLAISFIMVCIKIKWMCSDDMRLYTFRFEGIKLNFGTAITNCITTKCYLPTRHEYVMWRYMKILQGEINAKCETNERGGINDYDIRFPLAL